MKKIFKEIFDWIGILILIILGLLIISCDNRTEEQRWKDYQAKQEKARQDSIREARYQGFQVIVIDSCEYLIKKEQWGAGYRGYAYGLMSHKGNCKFCEERRKQESNINKCE